ncbi:hypothetical protein, partial [Thermodesulfatator autotrophicus]|uniref:hypothetical protein n=1 Tax=Thermodesulfatator autotrophicus TaxID=1795632 RepID=UPI001E3463BE
MSLGFGDDGLSDLFKEFIEVKVFVKVLVLVHVVTSCILIVNFYPQTQFFCRTPLRACRGPKKAIAIAHKILKAVYFIIKEGRE